MDEKLLETDLPQRQAGFDAELKVLMEKYEMGMARMVEKVV